MARVLRPSFVLAVGVACAAGARAQQGVVPLDAAQIVAGASHQFRGMGDFDGDGDVDLLSYYAGQFVQYMNDGGGSFVPGTPFSPSTAGLTSVYPAPIAVRDLDDDGAPDVVAARGHLVDGILTAPGAGAPTPYFTFADTATVNALVAGDFDGDGDVDVATIAAGALKLWLAQPGGGHALSGVDPLPYWLNAANGLPDALRLADLDADGVPEIVAAGSSLGFNPTLYLRVYGVVGGTLALKTAIQTPYPTPSNAYPLFAAGDVDGDGDEDVTVWIVPSNYTDPGYLLFRGDGAGNLAADPYRIGGPATQLADFDGDGDLDGVCCGGGGGTPPNQDLSTFEIALNDGAGNFAPAYRFRGKGSAGLVGAADLDGDGDRDLVAGLAVLWNRGTVPAVSGVPFGPTPTNGVPYSERSVGDCDGDGDLDLIQPSGLPCLVNDGTGAFAPRPWTFPAPPVGATFDFLGTVPCDVDGDGAADLLVRTRAVGTGAILGTRTLLHRGDGALIDGGPAAGGADLASWTPPGGSTPAYWSFVPDRTIAVDLDLDGDLDLVTRGQPSPSTPGVLVVSRAWTNLGGGAFAPGTAMPNFDLQGVVDVTGDGPPDGVGWVFPGGATTGTFAAIARNVGGALVAPLAADQYANPFAFLQPFSKLFAADLDGDGDVDLVRRYAPSLMNDGAGGFVAGQNLSVGVVAIDEFDGDGLPEILSAESVTFEIAVWSSPAAGQPFGKRGAFAALSDACDIRADWDGDGDSDYSKGQIRHARFHGAAAGGRRQYGAGAAGTDGRTPLLGLTGYPREGASGTLTISFGVGGAPGFLAFGATPLSVPLVGGTLYLDPFFVLPIVLDGAPGVGGVGRTQVPWTLPPGVAGFGLLQQAAFADPGSPSGVTLTQALQTTFGW